MKKISYLLTLSILFSLFCDVYSVQAAENSGINDIYVKFDESVSASVKATYSDSYSFNVGNSITYEVDIPEAGNYELYFNGGAYSYSVQYQIGTSAAKVVTADTDMMTNDYKVVEEYFVDVVALNKGKTTIVFKLLTGGMTWCGFRLKTAILDQSTDFSKKEGMYRTAVLPTVIEAEDFDLGTYVSADGINDGKKYRKNEGIDIYKNDYGNYISLSNGEAVEYSFNVEYADAFDFYASVLSGSGLNIWFDDYEKPYEYKWEDIDSAERLIASLYFEKGMHKIRIEPIQTDASVNFFRFETAAGNYTSVDRLIKDAEDEKNKVVEETPNPIYKEIYVSVNGDDKNSGGETDPFVTLERALEEVKLLNDDMTGDIIVNVLPGYYKINEKLSVTTEHSGKNGFDVVVKGISSEASSVISGGEKITDWSVTDDGKIWSAPVPDEVEEFRTMYVNEKSAFRARTKYLYQGIGSYHKPESEYIEDGAIIDRANFVGAINNASELESVWPIVWSNHRTPVEDVLWDDETVTIVGKQPAYSRGWAMTNEANHTQTTMTGGRAFYLENAKEFLDEPGEFYFDKEKHRVYYYPFKEEDMTTADVYAGVTEFLLNISGNGVEEKVTNIRFENLDFKYGAWNALSHEGMVVGQADMIGDFGENINENRSKLLPGQIQVKYADFVGFENCKFLCLGSSGIVFENDVDNSVINGNLFSEISGSGIVVDSAAHLKYVTDDSLDLSEHVKITNNVIRRTAIEFHSCIGIIVYYADGVTIEHNDIKDVAYSGISVGWGWGAKVENQRNHSVSYNRIVNTMQILNDGGAIYTLGPMPNTVINNNYINNSRIHGIYYDQGTSYLGAANNVLLNVGSNWLFAWSGASFTEIYCNNSFTNAEAYVNVNPAQCKVKGITKVEEDNLPDEAQKIYEESGVEDKYKHLLENSDYPEWRTTYVEITPKSVFGGNDGSEYVDGLNFVGGPEIGYHREVNETANRLNVFYDGEWAKYPIEISKDGEYNIDLMMSSGYFKAEWWPYAVAYIDDELVNPHLEIEKVTWQSLIAEPVIEKKYLTAGSHVLRLEWNQVPGGHVQLRKLKVTPTGEKINDKSYDEGILKEQKKRINFTDIEGHWAKKTIVSLTEKGIIHGISDELFAPEEIITAGQAALLYLRTKNRDEAEVSLLVDENSVDLPITRESFAVMIMSDKKEFDIQYSDSEFADQSNITEDALISVFGAKTAGLMTGDETGAFLPQSYLTRAEAAAVIERLMNN